MDPITLSLIASTLAGGISAYGQYRANQENIHEAEKNREWQERMSSTAYQRSMHDMALAGINPIMASKLGGASTPAGAQATVNDVISPAVQAALTVKRAEAEINNLQAQAENTDARTAQQLLQNQKLKLTTLPYQVGNTAIDVTRRGLSNLTENLRSKETVKSPVTIDLDSLKNYYRQLKLENYKKVTGK